MELSLREKIGFPSVTFVEIIVKLKRKIIDQICRKLPKSVVYYTRGLPED